MSAVPRSTVPGAPLRDDRRPAAGPIRTWRVHRRPDLASGGCRPGRSNSRGRRRHAPPAAAPRRTRSRHARGLEVTVAPGRQPGEGGRAGAGEVVVLGRPILGPPGVPGDACHVTAIQRQCGPVELDDARQARQLVLVGDDVEAVEAEGARPSAALLVSSHCWMPSRRCSTSSNSPADVNAPTNRAPSTGRTRTTSSGMTSTQPRMVPSCRVRCSPRDGELDEDGRAVDISRGQGVPHR